MTATTIRTRGLAAALDRYSERRVDSCEPIAVALGLQNEIAMLLGFAGSMPHSPRGVHHLRAHTLMAALARHYGVRSTRHARPRAALSPTEIDADTLAAATHQIVARTCEYETGRYVPGTARESSIGVALTVVDDGLAMLGEHISLDDHEVSGALEKMFTDYRADGWISPLAAYSAARFHELADRSACPFAGTASLWGADLIDPGTSLEHHVRNHRAAFGTFVRASRTEALDAYVFALPADPFGSSFDAASATLARLLGALTAEPDAFAGAGHDDGWRFTVDAEPFFVPVFCPQYDHDHPRYTHRATDLMFIVLQPDSSFHRQRDRNAAFDRIEIRRRFADRLQPYDASRREADKFLPLPSGVTVTPWYQRLPEGGPR